MEIKTPLSREDAQRLCLSTYVEALEGHSTAMVTDLLLAVDAASRKQAQEPLLAALRTAVRVAAEAAQAWDADRDARVGKLLLALEGRLKGYRADITTMHETIAAAESRA